MRGVALEAFFRREIESAGLTDSFRKDLAVENEAAGHDALGHVGKVVTLAVPLQRTSKIRTWRETFRLQTAKSAHGVRMALSACARLNPPAAPTR